jgi:hypothetical protein
VTNEEYLNMVMSRFDEAVQFHTVIKTLKLRFHNNPALPILIKMMEDERDESLGLGIQEYGILKKQELNVEGGAAPNPSNES